MLTKTFYSNLRLLCIGSSALMKENSADISSVCAMNGKMVLTK